MSSQPTVVWLLTAVGWQPTEGGWPARQSVGRRSVEKHRCPEALCVGNREAASKRFRKFHWLVHHRLQSRLVPDGKVEVRLVAVGEQPFVGEFSLEGRVVLREIGDTRRTIVRSLRKVGQHALPSGVVALLHDPFPPDPLALRVLEMPCAFPGDPRHDFEGAVELGHIVNVPMLHKHVGDGLVNEGCIEVPKLQHDISIFLQHVNLVAERTAIEPKGAHAEINPGRPFPCKHHGHRNLEINLCVNQFELAMLHKCLQQVTVKAINIHLDHVRVLRHLVLLEECRDLAGRHGHVDLLDALLRQVPAQLGERHWVRLHTDAVIANLLAVEHMVHGVRAKGLAVVRPNVQTVLRHLHLLLNEVDHPVQANEPFRAEGVLKLRHGHVCCRVDAECEQLLV
mmetsp:Transcript_30402/g.54619  ORF Transcript_30402/g.54619 Transcript_30402/m.54619 type:complete len:396 (-) Transcript_30402:1308-2495(-)